MTAERPRDEQGPTGGGLSEWVQRERIERELGQGDSEGTLRQGGGGWSDRARRGTRITVTCRGPGPGLGLGSKQRTRIKAEGLGSQQRDTDKSGGTRTTV